MLKFKIIFNAIKNNDANTDLINLNYFNCCIRKLTLVYDLFIINELNNI